MTLKTIRKYWVIISIYRLANVFVIAAFLYTFVAYGSLALVNRHLISGDGDTV